MSKTPVEVVIQDSKISVRYAGGQWLVGDIDNRWLWLLGAIANPEEHKIRIQDIRTKLEDHQTKIVKEFEKPAKMDFTICDTFTSGSGQKFSNSEDFMKELSMMISDCAANGGTQFDVTVDTDANCFLEEDETE